MKWFKWVGDNNSLLRTSKISSSKTNYYQKKKDLNFKKNLISQSNSIDSSTSGKIIL